MASGSDPAFRLVGRQSIHWAIELLREGRWITRARVLRWGGGFAVLSILALGWQFVANTTHGLTDATGVHLGHDFVNYWSGARLAVGGQIDIAYDPAAYNNFVRSVAGQLSEFKLYSYPPIAVLLTLPLAALPYIPGFILWSLLGIAGCAAVLARLVGRGAALLAAIGAPASMLDLATGQNGHFTAALLGGGLMVLDRRPLVAGMCFGVLSFKPQLGVLLPIALLVTGRWRAFATAVATVGVLGIVCLIVFGPESWTGYLAQADLQKKLMEAQDVMWHRYRTQSVFLAVRMLGAGVGAAYLAQAVSTILAIIATVRVWRSDAAHGIKAATLIVAAFLATPYAWDYDMVVLIFAAAWLANEGIATGFRPWERLAVLLLLAQPIVTIELATLTGIQIAPVGLWFAFAMLVRRALYPNATTRAAGDAIAVTAG